VKTRNLPYHDLLLGLAWLLGMFLLVPVDYDWTLVLRQHRIVWLDRWMAQSLFEGEPMGGGDPVILILLFVTGAYYLAWKKGPASRFFAWRPHLGFILVTAMTTSVMMVHSLKWVMGRARPSSVVKELLPYTDWFEFGPHFISQGTYRGSLPSGHTAQAFILITIAYILLQAPSKFKHQRLMGWLWGVTSLAYTLLMGISRCMHLSHWCSDVAFSMGMSWILMHLIYHRLLRVPHQEAYFKAFGHYPDQPRAWELRLCFLLFGAVLGGMAFVLGIRSLLLGTDWLLYTTLLPLGALIMFFFVLKSIRFAKRVRSGFDNAPRQPKNGAA
jgi:PAP2 superfamily protein